MLTANEIERLKKDANETLKSINLNNYNKDLYLLIGASLAIQKMDNNNVAPSNNKVLGFNHYFKKSLDTLKSAVDLYEIAEKKAITQEDKTQLKTFLDYINIILNKKQGC